MLFLSITGSSVQAFTIIGFNFIKQNNHLYKPNFDHQQIQNES